MGAPSFVPVRTPAAATIEACYAEHRAWLYRHCLRYAGGDTALAEDLVHDAFVRLLEHLPGMEAPDDVGGWLYRVAANLAISNRRRAGSFLNRVLPFLSSSGRMGHEEPPSADELMERRDLANAAVATLRSLPQRERVVICMRVLDGKSQREIAETLSLSEGYVSKLLARAWGRVYASGWKVGDGET